MLPATLTILGLTFNRAAEDSQTGTKYLLDGTSRFNSTSLVVRRVSKDNQPFVRFLLSYKAPAKVQTVFGTEPAVYIDSPTQSVVVNTTITIPNVHTIGVSAPDNLAMGIAAATEMLVAINTTAPQESTLSDTGDLLIAGHQ